MSVALNALHDAWQRVPADLRATFKRNHEENLRLKARVARVEKELQAERRIVRQLAGVTPRAAKPSTRRPALIR